VSRRFLKGCRTADAKKPHLLDVGGAVVQAVARDEMLRMERQYQITTFDNLALRFPGPAGMAIPKAAARKHNDRPDASLYSRISITWRLMLTMTQRDRLSAGADAQAVAVLSRGKPVKKR
jgi:hypothetical protein